jgi:hypothetical protein
MAAEAIEPTPNEEGVLRAVRWRFRICNYFFNFGVAWMLVGFVGVLLQDRFHADATFNGLPFVVELIGFAIFSSAFVLTLAIYRCPVCDKYLSRFRPRKEYCQSCGAKVR